MDDPPSTATSKRMTKAFLFAMLIGCGGHSLPSELGIVEKRTAYGRCEPCPWWETLPMPVECERDGG